MRRLAFAWVLCAGCQLFYSVPSDTAPADSAKDSATDSATDSAADGAPDAPGSDCPSFALFCDGFESGDLSAWDGSDEGDGALVTVASSSAYRGRDALHAVSTGSDGQGVADVYHSFALQSTGVVAVRTWLRSNEPLTTPVSILFLSNSVTNVGVAVTADSAEWAMVEYTPDEMQYNTLVPPALNTWTCVELDYAFDSATGEGPEMLLYVADQQILPIFANDTTAVFDRIAVGVTQADMTDFDISHDDVVIANQHIGCH